MILTITPNTALDRIIFIDEWTSGGVMRTKKIVTCVGGKGLDSSVVLRHLGVETVGLCFVSGKVGRELLEVVEDYGIIPDPVWVDGETRVAHVISEMKYHHHSHVIAGELIVSAAQRNEMVERFKKRVREASWVICAGSSPPSIAPDLYRTITEIAVEAGVPVLIDAFGEFIRSAIPARPQIVKMNTAEFADTFKLGRGDLELIKEQALGIYHDLRLKALVLTCAEDGILAICPEGVFQAVAPRQKAINAAGAGDAVSSALAWRFSVGDTWPEALRWAAAVSAAVVLTERTADCEMEEIRRIYPDVVVKNF
jgi:1-phosphofructokinase family hexose kinase